MQDIILPGDARAIVIGTTLMLAGVVLLRAVWARTIVNRIPGIVVSGMLVVAGIVVYAAALGSEDGTALAFAGFSALAYVVIAAGAERRVARLSADRELALEPELRPTNWTRAIAKALLAIVLAGVAAVGIGLAFAVAMPMNPADRIVIGGILVPMLWGAGMAWTLSDAKLLRATLLLVMVSVLAYGIAFSPRVAG